MPYFNNISVSKKNNIIWKMFFLILFFLSFIFIINFFNSQVKNFFYSFSSPVEKKFWNFSNFFSANVGSIFKSNALVRENFDLKRKNQELLSQLLSLQSINNANNAKSEILANIQTQKFNLSMASIIGSDEQGMVLINKGRNSGLKSNMPVVDKQNILFGRIEEVYDDFAKVMLVSDKRSIVNIKIKKDDFESSDVVGLLKGGGEYIYLDFIPVDTEISKDEIVVTSALEKVFPKDLLIGRITDVQKDSQKPFQQAKVAPFFDLGNTDYIFVITDYMQSI